MGRTKQNKKGNRAKQAQGPVAGSSTAASGSSDVSGQINDLLCASCSLLSR